MTLIVLGFGGFCGAKRATRQILGDLRFPWYLFEKTKQKKARAEFLQAQMARFARTDSQIRANRLNQNNPRAFTIGDKTITYRFFFFFFYVWGIIFGNYYRKLYSIIFLGN